jgi:hypothetical protein
MFCRSGQGNARLDQAGLPTPIELGLLGCGPGIETLRGVLVRRVR